jgi:hypothetical protein
MAPSILLALLVLASDPQGPAAAPASAPTPAAAPASPGEPLPPGAPKNDYELAAWCYGAMSEYLDIYQRVKPDLRQIDALFGSSVKDEAEPYADDMKAARVELKVLAGAVEAAEKASATPIAPRGVAAIKLGRSIWTPAEEKTQRELARAWLTWGLPDACDTRARQLEAKAKLLGTALTYNAGDSDAAPSQAAPATSAAPAQAAPAQPPPAAAPEPAPAANTDAIGAALAAPPGPEAAAPPHDR